MDCNHYWVECPPALGSFTFTYVCAKCEEIKKVTFMEREVKLQEYRERPVWERHK